MADADALPRPLRAVQTVTFAGRDWTLECDIEAIERFETSAARSIVHFIAETQHPGLLGAPKISERSKLLLALLARHHAHELAEVRESMLGWMNDLKVIEAINATVALAFPVAAGETPPAPEQPQARAKTKAAGR